MTKLRVQLSACLGLTGTRPQQSIGIFLPLLHEIFRHEIEFRFEEMVPGLRQIAKNHVRLGLLFIGRPLGKARPIGVARRGEVDPIGRHRACKGPIDFPIGSSAPKFVQVVEDVGYLRPFGI